MLRLFALLILLAPVSLSLKAQTDIDAAAWQEDLRYLQELIHEEYPFLLKKITAEEFDASVAQLHKAIPKMAEHEIIVGFASLVASFGYGHTRVRLPEKIFPSIPINLYRFSDGWFVQGAHKKYEKAVGARVLALNDTPIEKAFETIRPVVNDENDQFFKAYAPYYLLRPKVLHAKGLVPDLSSLTLRLEKEGQVFDMSFTPMATDTPSGRYGLYLNQGEWVAAHKEGSLPLWMSHLEKKYHFEDLPESKTQV